MKAFLLLWGFLQSFDFVLCESCLPRLGYVCKEIPTSYPADMSSLVLWVGNVGEINSTVFNNSNLASVTALTLEKNGITAIAPGAFHKFQSLKMLDLHSNGISLVTSSWFTHREALENFNLSSNRITALNNDSFHGLSGLLTLNLSYNQIQTVSADTFHSLGKLRHLDLSNNKLHHLSVETLRPANNSKLYLSGNPWNCSYTEFTVYLRELQKASLLENKMEVLCASPACLRGVPVWNVSKCVESITVDPTTRNTHTLQPTTSVQPQPPINWSVLIGLIVVLCALVLVICVLSVLYHRKRERKHLHTIRPSSEEPECGKQAQSDCRGALERSKNVELGVPDLNKKLCYRTQVLRKLDQTVLESEKMSQIYQIYGAGMFQNRDRINRAKSAGPVLSRTDIFGRPQETKVEDQKDLKVVKDKEMYGEWVREQDNYEKGFPNGMMEDKHEQQEFGNEESELEGIEKKHAQVEKVDVVDECSTNLESREKHKQNQTMEGLVEKEKGAMVENPEKQVCLQTDAAVFNKEAEDLLTSGLERHGLSQPASDDAVQLLEDTEPMPYLTIGTDPENQNLEQIPTESSTTRRIPSTPIRRVLTWPPTAVQWKKQWAQNPQVLNVFPKFVTGCQNQSTALPFTTISTSPEVIAQHQVSLFTSGMSALRQEGITEGCLSESTAVHKSPTEEATTSRTVEPLKEMCESAIHSYIHNLPNLAEDYAKLNEAQYGIVNYDPLLNSKVHSDLVHCSLSSEEMHSEESSNPSEESENVERGRRRKKVDQISKNQKMVSKERMSERQSRIREREGRKALGGPRDPSGSRVPPCGGSPSDESLLVDNEYAFIDLLHEVVENHGRWTRERWRQSHMNKQKHNQKGKNH